MLKPARSTGVNPILGLMTDPVNGPIGVCCIRSERMSHATRNRCSRQVNTRPIERLFLQISTSFNAKHQTDIMDSLSNVST